jgi:hypothetical protein
MHVSDDLVMRTALVRRCKTIAALFALVCTLGVASRAESLAITYHFSGAPTGPPTIVGPTYTVNTQATGDIDSSNLTLNAAWNPVENQTQDVIDLTTGMNNGTFTLTFADGGMLFGNLSEDDSLVVAGGGTGPFTQTLTFTGGTGEFVGATGSPEVVIEVASPGNRNLHRKAALYLQYGAEQVWIIDRKTQTIVVATEQDTREVGVSEYVEFHGVRVAAGELFEKTPADK